MDLSDKDYGYMASEFGLMVTLCLQDSQRGGDAGGPLEEGGGGGGGARVVARMMQVLQVLGACTVRGSRGIRAALRAKGLIKNCAQLLRTLFAAGRIRLCR
jgi:hypothetical protein